MAKAEKTIVIVGTAKHINSFDLRKLDGLETVSCNRILLHPYFRPTHLVLADRRPYMPELQSGRLERWAKNGGRIYLSKTLWDKKISCANTPVQKKPKWEHKEFALSGSGSPLNWAGFKKSFCSCANTGIALFQFAKIFGATRIATLGIGLVPCKSEQQGHCYTEKHGEDPWGRNESPKRAHEAAERIRNELKKMGIKVFNLAPKKGGVYENLFGRYDFDKFCRETKR